MLPVVLIGGVIALLLFASSSKASTAYARGPATGPGGQPLQGPHGSAIAPGGRGVLLPGIAPGLSNVVFHTAPPAPHGPSGNLVIPGGGVTPVSPPLVEPTPPPVPQTIPATVTTQQTGTQGDLAIRSDPHVTFPNTLENVIGWAHHGDTLLVTGPAIGDVSGNPALTDGWYPVLQQSTGITGFSSAAFLTLNLGLIA